MIGNLGHVEIRPPLMPAVSQVDLVRGGACGAVGNRSEISRGKAHVQIRTVRAPGAIDRCGVVVQRVVYVRTISNRVRGAAAGVLVRPDRKSTRLNSSHYCASR